MTRDRYEPPDPKPATQASKTAEAVSHDDAEWLRFEEGQDRSHRMRPYVSGEFSQVWLGLDLQCRCGAPLLVVVSRWPTPDCPAGISNRTRKPLFRHDLDRDWDCAGCQYLVRTSWHPALEVDGAGPQRFLLRLYGIESPPLPVIVPAQLADPRYNPNLPAPRGN